MPDGDSGAGDTPPSAEQASHPLDKVIGRLSAKVEELTGQPPIDQHQFDLEIVELYQLLRQRKPRPKEEIARWDEITNSAKSLKTALPPVHELPDHLQALPGMLHAMAQWAERRREDVPAPRGGRPVNAERLAITHYLALAWAAASGQGPKLQRRTGERRTGLFVDFARAALRELAPGEVGGDLGQRLDDDLRELGGSIAPSYLPDG